MKFYHGTTKDNWRKIQEEGVLWSKPFQERNWEGKKFNRFTYLTSSIRYAEGFSFKGALLEVEYEPVGLWNRINNRVIDTYSYYIEPEIVVFAPIDIKNIRRLKNGRTGI